MLPTAKIIFFILIITNIANSSLCFFTQFLLSKFPHISSLFGGYDTSKDISAHTGEEEFNFVKRVEQYGYSAEEYTILSKDGYNLILHRISGSPNHPKTRGKKVVYLQHGLAMWSINFILRGPGRDLVFLLADEGYDVWLGNVRGNALSKSNINIPIENASFWDFSYHEVALNDVSAFIDETLKLTGQDKLIYIGFSLGTTESFVLFSSLPEYNKKVTLLIELAPVALWKNNDKFFIRIISDFAKNMENLNVWLNIHEIFPLKTSKSTACGSFCQQLSQIIKPQFDSNRYDQLTLHNYEETYPAGTSVKTLFHLTQNIQSRSFEAYDYGVKQNNKIYGAEIPPKYLLQKITAPVALFYSHNDVFTTDKDIADLKKLLPNVVACNKVPYPMFTHFDFVWANDAKIEVYEDVLNLISRYT